MQIGFKWSLQQCLGVVWLHQGANTSSKALKNKHVRVLLQPYYPLPLEGAFATILDTQNPLYRRSHFSPKIMHFSRSPTLLISYSHGMEKITLLYPSVSICPQEKSLIFVIVDEVCCLCMAHSSGHWHSLCYQYDCKFRRSG